MHAVPQLGPATNRSNPGAGVERRVAVALVVALLFFCLGAAAPQPVAAVWKEREMSFTYVSDVAVYSCSALAGRVASILRAIGARDDVKVRTTHCATTAVPADSQMSDPGGPFMRPTDPLANRMPGRRPQRSQSSVVRAQFMMPAEITPEVAAELERDKSRRELVSHVTGDPLPRFDDPVRFAALRQQVTLSRTTIGLEPAECELLDQMSSSVFGELGVDVVRRNAACDRDRISRIPPEMVVEALLVAPADTGRSQQEDEQEQEQEDGTDPAPASATTDGGASQ